MAGTTKAIYQHHERNTTAQMASDIQERELGWISGTDVFMFKENSGDTKFVYAADNTIADDRILVRSANTIVGSVMSGAGEILRGTGFIVANGSFAGLCQADEGTFSSGVAVGASIIAGTLVVSGIITASAGITIPSGQYLEVDGNTLVVNAAGYEDKVGIGTATPDKLVDIVGSADNALLEGVQLSNTDFEASQTGQSIAINFKLSRNGTMRDAGRMVIGKDDTWNAAGSADSYMAFHTTLGDTRAEKVRITSAGDMGIGETDPDSKLEVNGTFHTTGASLFEGTIDLNSTMDITADGTHVEFENQVNGGNIVLDVAPANGSSGEIQLQIGGTEVLTVAGSSVISAQNFTIGNGAAGVDYTLTFDGEDSNGVITYDEDNGAFSLSHGLWLSDSIQMSSGTIQISSLTASTIVGLDGGKNLVSVAKSSAYTPSNVSTDRSYDADTVA